MPTVAPGSRIASPFDGCSKPAMILSRVDLPVPLGPTTPILAPCRNDSVTLSRTTLSPCALRTLRRVNTYSAIRITLDAGSNDVRPVPLVRLQFAPDRLNHLLVGHALDRGAQHSLGMSRSSVSRNPVD